MGKTKRYRATKSPNRKINIRSDETLPASQNSGKLNQLSESTHPANAESKTGLAGARDLSFLGREIFWIMVTTGIVIILLVVAYLLFR